MNKNSTEASNGVRLIPYFFGEVWFFTGGHDPSATLVLEPCFNTAGDILPGVVEMFYQQSRLERSALMLLTKNIVKKNISEMMSNLKGQPKPYCIGFQGMTETTVCRVVVSCKTLATALVTVGLLEEAELLSTTEL